MDDLIEKVGKMSDQLNNLEDITQAQVQDVVCKASTLCTQINATVDDIGQENVDKQSKILIREFKAGNSLLINKFEIFHQQIFLIFSNL